MLVIGERGTGKELIAERLHHLSSRWAGPLIIMNCAALPENLIEAELFGHEAGSFTGAAKTRHGRFEEADGGTLFLDELATLSMPAQDRLLRAVEYGEITRIGASKPISVDVRIVAATNENLPALVDKGKFRADLLDRLSFEVDHPAAAARARRATFRCSPSISGGAWRSSSTGRTGRASRPRALAELEAYPWPGNVRELRNVVERAVYRHEDPERPIDEISFDPFHSPWAPTAAIDGAARAGRSRRLRPTSEAGPRLQLPSCRRRRRRPSDFRAAVADLRAAAARGCAAPQPLQPARDRGRARPQLRPAAPRAEAPQAAGSAASAADACGSTRRMRPG